MFSVPPAAPPPDLRQQRGRALLQEMLSPRPDLKKAEFFLELGADLACCDAQGLSALCWAARQGHEDMALKLIAAGADVNYSSRLDWRPLHWAAVSGSIVIAEALLAKGAVVDAANDSRDTALVLATLLDGDNRKPFCELLLRHGADVRLAGAQGQTPLDSAIENKRQDLVALFTPLLESLKPATSPAALESATTLQRPLKPMRAMRFKP